ncbi:MAG: hypothetical protein V1873_02510 [Verrucomicrobiota bacterium]
MKSSRIGSVVLACSFLALLALVFLGCELQNTDSVTRTIGVVISGVYRHPTAGSTIISTNSGKPIDQLELRQSGDQLEAIDNYNKVYRGTAGNESDTLVTYSLEGQSSAGKEVTISGTIEVGGGSATMRGTWIEPGLYATVYGVATVPTNAGPGGLVVSPGSANLSSNSQTQVFTVTGGSGSYSWSVANSSGSLSSSSGASVTYTRVSSGGNAVNVSDTAGRSGSAGITQP